MPDSKLGSQSTEPCGCSSGGRFWRGHTLFPNTPRVGILAGRQECINKPVEMESFETRMQRQQTRPDFLGYGQLIGAPGFLDDVDVNIRLGRVGPLLRISSMFGSAR